MSRVEDFLSSSRKNTLFKYTNTSIFYSIRGRGIVEGIGSRYKTLLELRMESFRPGDVSDNARRRVRSHLIPVGHVPSSVPTPSNVEAVQDQETLPRRFRHPRYFVTSNVLNSDRHARAVLLLCNHRYGDVRGIRHAQLLQVSSKSQGRDISRVTRPFVRLNNSIEQLNRYRRFLRDSLSSSRQEHNRRGLL